jgi:hypothetical protein
LRWRLRFCRGRCGRLAGEFAGELGDEESDVLALLVWWEEFEVFLVVGKGVVFVAEVVVLEHGEVEVGGCVVWVECEALLEAAAGFSELTLAEVDDAEGVQCVWGVRGGAEVAGEGFLGLAPGGQAHVGDAEVVGGVWGDGFVL